MSYVPGQVKILQEFTSPYFMTSTVYITQVGISADASVILVVYDNNSSYRGLAVFRYRGDHYELSSIVDMISLAPVAISSIAVSPDGTEFICGQSGSDSSKGSIRRYTLSSADAVAWVSPAIYASDGAAPDQFGSALAWSADGLRLVVGAFFKGNKGAVYVFDWSGSAWVQGQKFIGAVYADNIGKALALNQDASMLAVGMLRGMSNYGGVNVYTRDGDGLYQLRDRIVQDPASSNAYFGFALAFPGEGSYLYASAQGLPATNQGTVYSYYYTGGAWSVSSSLTKAVPADNIKYGRSLVATPSGTKILIGENYKASLCLPFTRSVSGVVTDENGDFAARNISLIDTVTKELVNTGLSDGSTGAFTLGAATGNTHSIVAHDDVAGTNLNAIIFDKVLPL